MPVEKRNEDSGLIDLDALMRQASESGPILDVEQSGERPIVRAEPPAPAPAPVSAPAPAPASNLPPPPRKRGLLPVASAIALPIALATGAAVWMSRRPSEPVAARPVAIATTAAAATHAPAPAEPATGPAASDLPAAAASSAVLPTSSASARPRGPAAPTAAAVMVSDIPTEAAPGGGNDLGRAMHDAVGAREEVRTEANTGPATGARQLRPSPGAVVGAINAVLPAARACLGPDDPVRSGLLVFRADGTVARVELRGERPRDACIRTAMARARIEPFVDDTFTTRITVRP